MSVLMTVYVKTILVELAADKVHVEEIVMFTCRYNVESLLARLPIE